MRAAGWDVAVVMYRTVQHLRQRLSFPRPQIVFSFLHPLVVQRFVAENRGRVTNPTLGLIFPPPFCPLQQVSFSDGNWCGPNPPWTVNGPDSIAGRSASLGISVLSPSPPFSFLCGPKHSDQPCLMPLCYYYPLRLAYDGRSCFPPRSPTQVMFCILVRSGGGGPSLFLGPFL